MTDPRIIPRFKKERFLRSLSEDAFRDTVVRPLFLRLGYSDGRDLCGPEEQGKDAIFIETNKLGLVEMVAVQTKKGNLNLASRASNNVIVAATQLGTALATDVSISGSRRCMKPSKAILCASGTINSAARTHILNNITMPSVSFLDLDELIPLLDAHLPEVWIGVNVELLPYFEAITKLVNDSALPMPTMGSSSGPAVFGIAASDARFVTLTLFHTVLKVRTLPGGRIEKQTDVEEFPLTAVTRKPYKRVMIVGEAGSGKSTALLRLAYLMAQQGLTAGGKYQVPLLTRALDIYNGGPKTVADLSELPSPYFPGNVRPSFSTADLVDGRVTILIDSLDELPSDEARGEVMGTMAQLLVAYPAVQVIATSRPGSYTSLLSKTKSYTELRINAISWRQAQKLLSLVKAGAKLPSAQSDELLRRLEKIHGIELNPLLVTVFAATTDFTKQDIPANITELFKKFTELMLGRWDEAKGLRLQYQAQVKDFVLTRMAFTLHFEKRTSISREEAERLAGRELVYRGYEADASQLLGEIFDRSGLFRVVDQGIEFRHLLLQEFFAGRGIESIEQAKLLITDEWWKRALVFYFGEHPTHIAQLNSIATSISAPAGKELLIAATTVGLALQACYLSPVEAKLTVWKWVVEALSLSREAFISNFGTPGAYPLLGFLNYYIGTRDSAALMNLRGSLPQLLDWCQQPTTFPAADSETRMFWLIVGLIESGELHQAEELLKSYKPQDPRLLLAIHMGCFFSAHIRPVSQSERETAKRIVKRLNDHVGTMRSQVTKEFSSTLLEMRDGKLTSIEHEIDTQ
jgi:NACHT domain